jgi:hypothetical protein
MSPRAEEGAGKERRAAPRERKPTQLSKRVDPLVPSSLDGKFVPSSVGLPIELRSIGPIARVQIRLFRCFRGFSEIAVRRCLRKLSRSFPSPPASAAFAPRRHCHSTF